MNFNNFFKLSCHSIIFSIVLVFNGILKKEKNLNKIRVLDREIFCFDGRHA